MDALASKVLVLISPCPPSLQKLRRLPRSKPRRRSRSSACWRSLDPPRTPFCPGPVRAGSDQSNQGAKEVHVDRCGRCGVVGSRRKYRGTSTESTASPPPTWGPRFVLGGRKPGGGSHSRGQPAAVGSRRGRSTKLRFKSDWLNPCSGRFRLRSI